MAIIVETLVNGTSVNATTTPGANKVPIADGAGKLASGWGGSASTLATLNGSVKVVENPASATATPTLTSIPISDGAGKLAAGWGGAASTLATLNGSVKVVENPASASTTPGAAVIPIADGSGDLDVGFVPDRVVRWVKVTKAYTDFSFAGLTNDIEVLSLPSKGVIQKVVLKHTTAFSGGAIASYTVSVGVSGNFTKYAAAFDVFQATGNTVFGFNNLQNMENFGSATSIRALATATGDNLDQATAGSVDIYIGYSVLP